MRRRGGHQQHAQLPVPSRAARDIVRGPSHVRATHRGREIVRRRRSPQRRAHAMPPLRDTHGALGVHKRADAGHTAHLGPSGHRPGHIVPASPPGGGASRGYQFRLSRILERGAATVDIHEHAARDARGEHRSVAESNLRRARAGRAGDGGRGSRDRHVGERVGRVRAIPAHGIDPGERNGLRVLRPERERFQGFTEASRADVRDELAVRDGDGCDVLDRRSPRHRGDRRGERAHQPDADAGAPVHGDGTRGGRAQRQGAGAR